MSTSKDQQSTPFASDAQGRLFICKTVAVCATALCLILAIIACSVALETDSGYFKSSAVKYVFYCVTALASCACIIPGMIFFSGKKNACELHLASEGVQLFAISLLPGIAAVLSITLFEVPDIGGLGLVLCLFSFLPLAFAAIPSRYFLPRAIAGCFQCAFIVLAIALLYFDSKIEINNPVKIFLQLGLATALLESLGEIKDMLGTRKAWAFIAAKALAFAISAAGATVGIFAAFTCERFSRAYLCIALFLLCFAVHSGCSLLAAKEK